MIRALEVQPRQGRTIWLRFSDGTTGEVDLSQLADRGVFQAWDKPGFFRRVHVASHGAVAWSDEIEICADALYMDLSGKTADEVLSGLSTEG